LFADIIITLLIALLIFIFVTLGLLTYDLYLNNVYKRNIKEWTKTVEEWIPILDFINDKSIYLMKETHEELIKSFKIVYKQFHK